MRAFTRGLVTAVVAVGATWAGAVAAAAQTPTGPCERTDGYIPAAGCAVLVDNVAAVCTDEAAGAWLNYALTTQFPADSVRITFRDGARSTSTTGPLQGQVPWPVEIDAASATVTFAAFAAAGDTSYTATVKITSPDCSSRVLQDDPNPTTTPAAAAPGAGSSPSGTTALARTGAQVGPVAGVAIGMMIFGGLIYLASRRRTV